MIGFRPFRFHLHALTLLKYARHLTGNTPGGGLSSLSTSLPCIRAPIVVSLRVSLLLLGGPIGIK